MRFERPVGCKSRPSYGSSDNEHESRSPEPEARRSTHHPSARRRKCWDNSVEWRERLYAPLLAVLRTADRSAHIIISNLRWLTKSADSPSGMDPGWRRPILAAWNIWLPLSLHDSVGGSRGVPRVLNTCRLRSSFIYWVRWIWEDMMSQCTSLVT